MTRSNSKSKKNPSKVLIFIIIVIAVFWVYSKLNKPAVENHKASITVQNDCKTVDGVNTCLSAY